MVAVLLAIVVVVTVVAVALGVVVARAVIVAALLVAVRLVAVVAGALAVVVLFMVVALVIVRCMVMLLVAVRLVRVLRFVVRVLARVVRRAGVAVVEVRFRLLLGLQLGLGRLGVLERRQGLLLGDRLACLLYTSPSPRD